MKNVLICLSLVCFGAVASAFTINITASKVHDDHKNSRAGTISTAALNFDEESAQLSVHFNKKPCPAGRMCPAVMPSAIKVDLENVAVNEGSCGDTYEYESADSSEKLVITDYRQMKCKMRVVDQIRAVYTTVNQDGDEAESVFYFKDNSTVEENTDLDSSGEDEVVTWFNCRQEKQMPDNTFSAKVYVNGENFEEAVMVVTHGTIAGPRKQSYQMEVFQSRRVGATTITLDNEVISLTVTQVVNPNVKAFPAVLSLKEAGRNVKLVCAKEVK